MCYGILFEFSDHLARESHKLRTLFLTNAENGCSVIGGLRLGCGDRRFFGGENELVAAGI